MDRGRTQETGARRFRVLVLALVAIAAFVAAVATAFGSSGAYHETLLVSDRASSGAPITDPTLQNPWGIAFGPTTPLWVVKNDTNLTTLYRGANGVDPITKLFDVGLIAGPTGIVFNPTGDFIVPGTDQPARFIFDSLSGEISAWTNLNPLPATDTVAVPRRDNASFTGLAIAPNAPGGSKLYAADNANGVVRVYNGKFKQIMTFTDRDLPGLTPYGIQVIGERVYVTFEPRSNDEKLKGAVDVFSRDGKLLKRLIRGGPLDGPWGVALAPADWGAFSGDLLVGNEDGGQINAFDPASGQFEGTVSDENGKAIAHDGLWGIAFGNGVIGTPETLIIVAGVDEYEHGIIEGITPAQ